MCCIYDKERLKRREQQVYTKDRLLTKYAPTNKKVVTSCSCIFTRPMPDLCRVLPPGIGKEQNPGSCTTLAVWAIFGSSLHLTSKADQCLAKKPYRDSLLTFCGDGTRHGGAWTTRCLPKHRSLVIRFNTCRSSASTIDTVVGAGLVSIRTLILRSGRWKSERTRRELFYEYLG